MNKKIASKSHTYLVWIHVKRSTLAVEQKKIEINPLGLVTFLYVIILRTNYFLITQRLF